MSKTIPTKLNVPKVPTINVNNVNDAVKKGTSSVTKWLPFICAGTAVGVSILALKELKKIKNEMTVVKNQQVNTTVKSDPLLNKKMEQLEEQLKKIQEELTKVETKEGKDGNYMAKPQLFIIATLAQKMWEIMEDNEELDDWMESKIAQAEQSITSVVKAYMYDEVTDNMKGMETLNYNEIVIGK